MPELPEVETIRRGLAPLIIGRRIARVHLARKDLRLPFPPKFAERLAGARVEALSRRAKYLLASLDTGETLIVHLGMSGQFVFTRKPPAEPRLHDHVVIALKEGGGLVFNDPRRFGLMTLARTDTLERHPLLRHLGLEPLDGGLTGEAMLLRLAKRKTSLKAALMDQRFVAGVGNIYASEALHRAGLSPKRGTRRLGRDRAERLAAAVQQVLSAALDSGGSTLRDYVRADGGPGYFQHRFLVYDRAGKPCLRPGCGGHIRRIVQANRSTYYCPVCQR